MREQFLYGHIFYLKKRHHAHTWTASRWLQYL